MKKFILIIVILIQGTNFASAQETETWKINSIKVLSGESPLSSGIASSINLSKGKSTLFCDFNSTLGEALYFYAPVKWFSFGYSGGVFKSQIWVPWSGPIASFNLFNGHLTTLHWLGWSLGNPEAEKFTFNTKFCFSYQQISLNWKFAEIYYALMHYQMNNPEHIFGTKMTLSLCKQISIFGGLGYMTQSKRYLWSMGLNCKF